MVSKSFIYCSLDGSTAIFSEVIRTDKQLFYKLIARIRRPNDCLLINQTLIKNNTELPIVYYFQKLYIIWYFEQTNVSCKHIL